MRTILLNSKVMFLLFVLTSFPVHGKSANECLFRGNVPPEFECGILSVPEDHFSQTDRSYDLPYLIIKPSQPAQDLPPVIYLNGGPGHSTGIDSRATTVFWKWLANTLAPDRAFIIPELRGSRNSVPTLDCPELHAVSHALNAVKTGDEDRELENTDVDPGKDCLKRLKETGLSLSSVNRLQIAHDIKKLAMAIGQEKVALLGVSYGTTYAMTIASEFPQLPELMVLDSVFPPEATNDIEGTFHLENTLAAIFEACENQDDCNETYPDLRKQFFEFFEELNNNPLEISFANRQVHEKQTARFDPPTFLSFIRAMIGWPGFLSQFPEFVANKDEQLIRYWVQKYADYGGFDQFSYGAFMAGNCYDLPLGFNDSSMIEKSLLLNNLEATIWSFDSCNDWNTERASPEHRMPLISNVPTLILASRFDPATPISQARIAERGLKKSHMFAFPLGTHVLIFSDHCAQTLTQEFLKAPEVKPPTGCHEKYPEFRFDTKPFNYSVLQ